jgi:hypothetical protein
MVLVRGDHLGPSNLHVRIRAARAPVGHQLQAQECGPSSYEGVSIRFLRLYVSLISRMMYKTCKFCFSGGRWPSLDQDADRAKYLLLSMTSCERYSFECSG